ncbi:MAG: HDOD domain-containing protein [Desulfuromonadaceae bacterium]|nr:HDOD domain-containing protein [Desulfuromonadaceae bacterium]
MNTVLFVDDEELVLRSIERELRHSHEKWNLLFASSADEALSIMAQQPVDILVTDFKMPQMSGLELLTIVENLYPRTLRILLTGYTSKIKYVQTTNLCHYFFYKPFKIEGFKRFLDRASDVVSLLNNPGLVKHLNAISFLPLHPNSFDRLSSCFAHYDTQPQQLLHIAQKDISLALQLFKLSSSANFTLESGINSLADAIDYIDMENFRALFEGQQVFVPNKPEICKEFELDLMQNHSFQVAHIAEALARMTHLQDRIPEVKLAALLHDAGRIVLAHAFPEVYRHVFGRWQQEKEKGFATAESQILGSNHAQAGAYLAALWGVPFCVVRAICQHVQPAPPCLTAEPISHLVWHANRLAQGKIDKSRDYYSGLCQDSHWQLFFNRLTSPKPDAP